MSQLKLISKLGNHIAVWFSAWVVVGLISARAALAQTMPAPSDVSMEEALGDATADAETGIYQIRETIEDGWGVIIVIVLTVVGFMLVRRLFRRAGAN